MRLVRDTSKEEFLQDVGPLLYQNEAANSLMLGVCEGLTPIYLARLVDDDGKTVSAAVQLPVRNLILSAASDEALSLLAHDLFSMGAELPGVVGPEREVTEFTAVWCELTGLKSKLAMGQMIYQLDDVKMPVKMQGELRAAQKSDAQLIAQWFEAFALECLPKDEHKAAAEWMPRILHGIQNGWAYVWVNDGVMVSMAHVARPTRNGITVNAVYTPKDHRRKGYASAAVACVSQLMLESGREFCVLYTDLGNPTSNKIYQEIGYREVAASKYFQFS